MGAVSTPRTFLATHVHLPPSCHLAGYKENFPPILDSCDPSFTQNTSGIGTPLASHIIFKLSPSFNRTVALGRCVIFGLTEKDNDIKLISLFYFLFYMKKQCKYIAKKYSVVARKATRGLCCWLFDSVNCMENFSGEPPPPPPPPTPLPRVRRWG